MDALILASKILPRAALFDIAGKPLVLRQVQWLRAAGCERIVVGLPPGDVGGHIADALAREPLGPGVSWGPIQDNIEEARRELGLSACVILLPGDTLGDGDLVRLFVAQDGDAEVQLVPPAVLSGAIEGATVLLLTGRSVSCRKLRGPGWGVRLRSEEDAFALSLAVLDGGLSKTSQTAWSVQIHASKVVSGVWVAQGAVVHETANLLRPVFVGPNAVVGRDVVLGPGVVLGEAAQVGSLARLRSAVVEQGSAIPADSDIADVRVVPVLPAQEKQALWGLGLGLGLLVVGSLLAWGLS